MAEARNNFDGHSNYILWRNDEPGILHFADRGRMESHAALTWFTIKWIERKRGLQSAEFIHEQDGNRHDGLTRHRRLDRD